MHPCFVDVDAALDSSEEGPCILSRDTEFSKDLA
jgi:hypothetical protein